MIDYFLPDFFAFAFALGAAAFLGAAFAFALGAAFAFALGAALAFALGAAFALAFAFALHTFVHMESGGQRAERDGSWACFAPVAATIS